MGDIQNLQEQFPQNLGDGRGPYFIRARGLLSGLPIKPFCLDRDCMGCGRQATRSSLVQHFNGKLQWQVSRLICKTVSFSNKPGNSIGAVYKVTDYYSRFSTLNLDRQVPVLGKP